MSKVLVSDTCEVAVIGAGPYGLAVAAHLTAANVATRVFGEAMAFWRNTMPSGMVLRSPWNASHIADPDQRYSLDVFAHRLAIAPAPRLGLDQFLRYGAWYARLAAPDLDTRRVMRVEDIGRGFYLGLEDGAVVHARRVVVALGLANQEVRPRAFDGLPRVLVSHSSEHRRLDLWRGQRVAVIGRGQGACESAALIREAGAEVELICRGDIRWPEAPQLDAVAGEWRRWLRAMRTAPSAIGPFPLNRLNEHPGLVRFAPAVVRWLINRASLQPAPADWLKPRLADVPVHQIERLAAGRTKAHKIGVQLREGWRLYDHALLATGYRPDVARYGILASELIAAVAPRGGSPRLRAGFESAVPGLHFVGACAARSYGPLMHVVAGTGYAARSITRMVLARRGPVQTGGGKSDPKKRGTRSGFAVLQQALRARSPRRQIANALELAHGVIQDHAGATTGAASAPTGENTHAGPSGGARRPVRRPGKPGGGARRR